MKKAGNGGIFDQNIFYTGMKFSNNKTIIGKRLLEHLLRKEPKLVILKNDTVVDLKPLCVHIHPTHMYINMCVSTHTLPHHYQLHSVCHHRTLHQ